MTTSKKVIIIVGSTITGALSGCSIAFPDLAPIFASVAAAIAVAIATLTGISLAQGE